QSPGMLRFWYAPTLFWFSSSSHAMMVVVWAGLIASVLAFANVWPRVSFLVCWVCFLAFVAAAGDFSGYQSDGMLLEAGFLALFVAPNGWWPGWGLDSPPSRVAFFLLQWEWFRIYFESGIVKLLSGDPQWRSLSAMDQYYQNGPLPTFVGWYVQHLPHWFHVGTAAGTLVMELAIVWMLFLPRRVRVICFCIVTPWEIGVILTANYAFLNYLVLFLGFLLLDDRALLSWIPERYRHALEAHVPQESVTMAEERLSVITTPEWEKERAAKKAAAGQDEESEEREVRPGDVWRHVHAVRLAVTAVILTWLGYATTTEMLRMPWPELPLPVFPIAALEPFRIANQYGLFAVMTRGRYEIEFQGSNDGENWTPYPFRHKPQALNGMPGIYAPYQPRFDWNLWFASLTDFQNAEIVPLAEERLLEGDGAVLSLFKGDPFHNAPPRYIRAVLWQYWFTTLDEKHDTGNWWRRTLLGLYGPVLTREPGGKFAVVQWPEPLPPHN
ncbi:MAG TPA: lipase maturation factor family protein, partial [Acidobacteriaceae bacterium]|nr:lipase maturation factor family protein [Acidobacteriaceae bacterium]